MRNCRNMEGIKMEFLKCFPYLFFWKLSGTALVIGLIIGATNYNYGYDKFTDDKEWAYKTFKTLLIISFASVLINGLAKLWSL